MSLPNAPWIGLHREDWEDRFGVEDDDEDP